MKKSTTEIRASHVNSKTACFEQQKLFPQTRGAVFRRPKLQVEEASDSSTTPHGGLVLPLALIQRLRIAQRLDARVSVLRRHVPYRESDHFLTQALNLYVGGGCLEDIAALQTSEAVRRMLGACRIPDPTTAGDFLRRFDDGDLDDTDHALDEVQAQVWKRRWGKRRQKEVVVDLDSHLCPVYGMQKEGADFTYKGQWAYHPLIVSIAKTGEVLRLINRPGNVVSQDGAASVIAGLSDLLTRRFKRVIIRGDSAFGTANILRTCAECGYDFALVFRGVQQLRERAEQLDESEWKPFVALRKRRRLSQKPLRRRRRRWNRRQRTAKRRGMPSIRLAKQWLAAVPYQLSRRRDIPPCRLIIRRQRLSETDSQGHLFEKYRYRFVVTSLKGAPQDIIDLTYQRCDQENVIEQLKNGVSAFRMPTGTAAANGAFLRCARLAHNLKAWLAVLALPTEFVRWHWKRFRHALVHIAATVVLGARQTRVRLHLTRSRDVLMTALAKLQT